MLKINLLLKINLNKIINQKQILLIYCVIVQHIRYQIIIKKLEKRLDTSFENFSPITWSIINAYFDEFI